jgi:hypothetical protein
MQKVLTPEQLSVFYHNHFVSDQIQAFKVCFYDANEQIDGTIIDIGGGVGYFADAVKREFGYPVRVIDMGPLSVKQCEKSGLDAELGDCSKIQPRGDESIVCFNLILHHLVANSDKNTRSLQKSALSIWHGKSQKIFVNEYIYDSYAYDLSGWLIYKITSSRFLSGAAKAISKIIPSFRANTFGTGVRFRSHNEWLIFFKEAGFNVTKSIIGRNENVALPLRILFIKSIRRDSFCLETIKYSSNS